MGKPWEKPQKYHGKTMGYSTDPTLLLHPKRRRQAVIKNADMAEDMQQDAIDSATQALEKYNIETLFFLRGKAGCELMLIDVH